MFLHVKFFGISSVIGTQGVYVPELGEQVHQQKYRVNGVQEVAVVPPGDKAGAV